MPVHFFGILGKGLPFLNFFPIFYPLTSFFSTANAKMRIVKEYYLQIEDGERIYGTSDALLAPEGMTWLNGTPLEFTLRQVPIDQHPVVSNRPAKDDVALETLMYDHVQSRPLSEERTAVYHPITPDGLLDVLVNSEARQVRVTLIAEYLSKLIGSI